jgi:uncharacterized protein
MELKTNVVTWFEIYVDDIDRAKKFYGKVLALEMEDMPVPENMNEFRMVSFPWAENAPNANGALVQTKEIKAGGNSTLVYFTCNDCSQEESRVTDAGGKVLKPKFSIGEYGFCSICEDTEGNTFGLHSMK